MFPVFARVTVLLVRDVCFLLEPFCYDKPARVGGLYTIPKDAPIRKYSFSRMVNAFFGNQSRQGGSGIEKKDPGSIFLLRPIPLD